MNQYYVGQKAPKHHAGMMAEAALAEQQQNACVALLWLKGTPDDDEKHQVLRTLGEIDGVLGLKFVRENPAVMMVDYCGKEVRVEHLVSKVAVSGSVIRRVGC